MQNKNILSNKYYGPAYKYVRKMVKSKVKELIFDLKRKKFEYDTMIRIKDEKIIYSKLIEKTFNYLLFYYSNISC